MRLGIGRSPVHGLSGLDPSDDTALQVQDFLEPGLAELFRGAGASPASAAVDRYRTLLVKAIQALIDEIVRVYIYVHCAGNMLRPVYRGRCGIVSSKQAVFICWCHG